MSSVLSAFSEYASGRGWHCANLTLLSEYVCDHRGSVLPEVLGSCLFPLVVDCLTGGLVILVCVPGKKGQCRNTSELSVVLPYLHFPVLLGESLVNSLTVCTFQLECRLNDRTEGLASTGFCLFSSLLLRGVLVLSGTHAVLEDSTVALEWMLQISAFCASEAHEEQQ